ncbi:hypothetical protein Tco_0598501 [Tanacetum coccineum]
MSNSNTNLQTQSSNALHNAIMEAGSKDRPPMLAPGNYVQWKSRIKRYIDTKPNSELIHYSLQNPPYIYQWAEKTVPVAEGIDNDIYSTVDACPNACEMWKAIERLKQGESINVQDLETNLYWEFGKFTSRDGESLESSYFNYNQKWKRFVTLVKQESRAETVLRSCKSLGFSVTTARNMGMYQGNVKSQNEQRMQLITRKRMLLYFKLRGNWKNIICYLHNFKRLLTDPVTILDQSLIDEPTLKKFWESVKFGNDQIAPILGYGDLVQGAITIKRVYYVEGLNHNLFSVGQFCDADLEVAFRKSTCYIRDLKGNDLLTGSRGTDLYSITLQGLKQLYPLLNGLKQHILMQDPPPLNIYSTHQTPTQVPTLTAHENIIQAETNTENVQFDDDEFINIFSTPVQEQGETSSRHVDTSNMHTFYQHHPSTQRWTKDHPLEQVIGNPSESVRTRRQLKTDGEMCMFTLT